MPQAYEKTKAVLDRHLREAHLEPRIKVAEFDPDQFKSKDDFGGGSFMKRAIPKNFPYDPKALKPLAQTLWAMSVALGHTLTAHRQLSKIKSSTVSPDGLIGGQGYVMSIKEVRKALYNAAEGLSSISDTIHDEINAPHWKPKLAELERNDIESVERLVGEAEQIMENPEEEVEEGMEEAEQSGERAEMEEGEGEPKSQLPDNANLPDAAEVVESGQHVKQASEYGYDRRGSSLPTQTLPGPRVQHLDRADVDQTGPFGSHNTEEPMSTHDEWSRTDGVPNEYLYQSEWDNNLLDKTAERDRELAASVRGTTVRTLKTSTKSKTLVTPGSVEAELEAAEGVQIEPMRSAASNLPDKDTDPTPTKGYDFGIGYGDGNDAHGQGAGGYGTVDSDGGVYGPSSELPGDLDGGSTERDDTTPTVELAVGGRNAKWKTACSMLPLDVMPSVARSDYYEGDKADNEVNATSEVPEVESAPVETPRDMIPGTAYSYDQGNQPYIKWDSDTRNMECDYVYQREVEEGPYEREG